MTNIFQHDIISSSMSFRYFLQDLRYRMLCPFWEMLFHVDCCIKSSTKCKMHRFPFRFSIAWGSPDCTFVVASFSTWWLRQYLLILFSFAAVECQSLWKANWRFLCECLIYYTSVRSLILNCTVWQMHTVAGADSNRMIWWEKKCLLHSMVSLSLFGGNTNKFPCWLEL